jgi:hypothetical protein
MQETTRGSRSRKAKRRRGGAQTLNADRAKALLHAMRRQLEQWVFGNPLAESWVIPWSRLARIRCTGERNDASLELTFDHLSVQVSGHNLAGLLEDLGACKISCLRELPAEYRAMVRPTRPFVSRIDLTDLNPQRTRVVFRADSGSDRKLTHACQSSASRAESKERHPCRFPEARRCRHAACRRIVTACVTKKEPRQSMTGAALCVLRKGYSPRGGTFSFTWM